MKLMNISQIKSSMAPQAYSIITNHDHEVSGWIILYIIIHKRETFIGETNGDVQYDLATLA